MLSSAHPRAQRILQGAVNPVVRVTLRDQDGEPASASGTLTATVKSLDGTTSGSANRSTAAGTGDGNYTASLTSAEAASLTMWAVEWSDGGTLRTTTYHRIVGGFMVSRATLRARPGLETQDDPTLDAARFWIQDLIEHQTGCAWNPRYDLDATWQGEEGRDRLILRYCPVRSIESLSIDGTTEDEADLDIDYGAGVLRGFTFLRSTVVGYTHGYDQAPEDLVRAAEVAAADVIMRNASGLSERTRSKTNELGHIQTFSFPGIDHPTGIDFVDAAILAHDHRTAGVA